MRRNLALVAMVVWLMPVVALPIKAQDRLLNNRRAEKEVDPDQPKGLPAIDDEEYQRLRARHVAKLRGLDHPNHGPWRRKAIDEMERQQKSKFHSSGAGTPSNASSASQAGLAAASASAAAWTPIGPAPIPNGQTTGVPMAVSGRVTALAVHPNNANIVYVGTAQGGLYRTLNGGLTWTALMDSAKSLAIGAIAIAPSSPTTVFVGTGEASFSCDSFFGVGVYRIDNAESTANLTGPLNLDSVGADVFTGRAVAKILVHPNDPNIIFVASASGIGGVGCDASTAQPSRGLFRSTNALSAAPTFAKLTVVTANGGNRSITDLAFEPGNPNTLLCSVLGFGNAGDGGIWRTTNALDPSPVFVRTLALGTTTAAVRSQLAITKSGGTVTVLAATGEAGTGICATRGQSGQLRVSSDGGQNWSIPLSSANGFCGGQCGYDIAVAVEPGNPNAFYLGGSANSTCSSVLTKSTDGASMPRIDTGLHADTHAIAIAPSSPSIVYLGSDGGVWKSTDAGAHWASLNNTGFNATQFQSLALHPTDANFILGGTQDNGTEMRRSDQTWTRADFGDGGFALIDQNATDTINVTMYHTYFNQVGRNGLVAFARVVNTASAQDDGWDAFGCGAAPNGLSCNDSAVEFFAPIALGPGNPNTLYFGTDRLYRSVDSGANMFVVSQQFAAGVPVSAISVAPQNDNVRLVGLENGKVFATATGAATLSDITGPIPAKYVARAVIDPNNANTAYVTLAGFGLSAGQHVWKTTNLNAATPTWTTSGNGIPDIPVNAFAVDPADSTKLYAGTDIGVYCSTNGGASWSPFGTGLPVVAVFDLAIHKASRTLRIATHGRGMWEISLGVVIPPAPPAAPSGLSATASSATQINLAWTDNSTNEAGFKIERCQGVGCANFAQIDQVGAGTTGYSDTSVAASTTYVYRVRATNGGGDSAYSNTAAATTPAPLVPPTAPSSLSATAASSSQINLAWTDNSNNEGGFKIERCQGSGCKNFTQVAQVGAGTTSFSNTGLSRNTSYTYRVRAFNAAGTSTPSNTASAKTQR